MATAAPYSLQEQIDHAQPGDTLSIDGGVYNERIVIDKPLVLEGQDWPVIDGGGDGDVVTITADDVTISGFVIRHSGHAVSLEPAAIKINEAHAPTVKHNRIESSQFGVHATGSHHVTIANNDIDLGDVAIERRGHAVYFWEVGESAIDHNNITNAGDGIHFEFSDDNGLALNTVSGSRYALHFMSSNNNRVIQNTFTNNLSGAVLMFSNDVLLKDNELSNNRQGATGAGILAKDVNNLFVDGNTITRNKYGLMADGTPQTADGTATFMHNLFALNDTGVGLRTNAPITFVENAMVENTVQVVSLGGDLLSGDTMSSHAGAVPQPEAASSANTAHEGHTTQSPSTTTVANTTPGQADAVWSIGGRGNYWSDYSGYDEDDDGVGDQPYRPEPAFAGALSDNPMLRLFQFTLAQEALDMAADMFPVYRYDPVIEDSAPLMSAPALPDAEGTNGSLLLVSIVLIMIAVGVAQFACDFDPLEALLRRGKRVAGHLKGSPS